MSRKPRKKKVQPIPKLWEMDEAAILAVIQHLSENYPDSAILGRYKAEIKRRQENKPIPEITE